MVAATAAGGGAGGRQGLDEREGPVAHDVNEGRRGRGRGDDAVPGEENTPEAGGGRSVNPGGGVNEKQGRGRGVTIVIHALEG